MVAAQGYAFGLACAAINRALIRRTADCQPEACILTVLTAPFMSWCFISIVSASLPAPAPGFTLVAGLSYGVGQYADQAATAARNTDCPAMLNKRSWLGKLS